MSIELTLKLIAKENPWIKPYVSFILLRVRMMRQYGHPLIDEDGRAHRDGGLPEIL